MKIADLGKVRFIPYMFNPQDFEISKAFFESLTILESKHELPEKDRSYKKDTFPCSFCKFIPVCYQEEVK